MTVKFVVGDIEVSQTKCWLELEDGWHDVNLSNTLYGVGMEHHILCTDWLPWEIEE